MPALPLIPPKALLEILLKYAYEIVDEDAFCWVLRRGEELPLILTKRGHVVTRDFMEAALKQAKMDNLTYFKFLKEVCPETIAGMTIEEKS